MQGEQGTVTLALWQALTENNPCTSVIFQLLTIDMSDTRLESNTNNKVKSSTLWCKLQTQEVQREET